MVNKIIQGSGAYFHSTSSVSCTACSPAQVTSQSITINPPLPSFPSLTPAFPLIITTLLSVSLNLAEGGGGICLSV